MARRLWLLLAFLPNAALAVANTLVISAKVITVDKNHPSAHSFAFDNGHITALMQEVRDLGNPVRVGFMESR